MLDKIVKNFVKKLLAACFVVVVLFWKGQTELVVWTPVLVAAALYFILGQITQSSLILAVGHAVVIAGSCIAFGAGVWTVAGILGVPFVYELVDGGIQFLADKTPPAAK